MAEAYDLEYWSSLMSGARVLRLTHAGDWQAAEKLAGAILSTREPAWRARLLALICLGRIEARRGQSQMPQHLEAATRVASHDPALASMLWPARAEAAWLVGDHVQLSQEVAAMRSAVPKDPWFTGELAFWCHLAGHPLDELQLDSAEPYRLAQAEAWSAAAEWWTARGCPYEAALCLAKSDDPHLVRSAIAQLDQLGAVAAAAFARRHLRALGVTSVPRGPRPSTSANPAGLTRREQEVLKFVAEGCANAEIAARLFLSEKTVERHLSGAFGKLQAGSRTEAVAVARRIGALADRPA